MNKNLPIYEVPAGDLDKYSTSKKDVKNQQEKIPPAEFRNHDEDVYEPWTPSNKPLSQSSTISLNTEEDDLE